MPQRSTLCGSELLLSCGEINPTIQIEPTWPVVRCRAICTSDRHERPPCSRRFSTHPNTLSAATEVKDTFATMATTAAVDKASSHTRRSHRPVLRRLGRRHAARRRAVHEHVGAGGQRHRDVPRLPGRDSRPAGHAGRRLRFSGSLFQQGYLHAGRHGRRAGGDEPGRAGDEPRRPAHGRHPDRQQRRLRREGPRAGRLRRPIRSKTAASSRTACTRST